ncbi:unnamed protein product [Closterium sp. NIES-65]|nr:unnamed protein product [Closterium sp. NIES-65]
MVAAAELGGPDAASGGGSASPSAIPQAWQPEESGPPVAQERTKAVELAASPEPVTASVLAAAVTATTGEQGGARTEEGASVAAANAETSAAAEGASTQGHNLGGSSRQGRGAGGTAGAARGKTTLRAQREDRNRQAEASRTPALGGERRLAEQGEECEGPEGDGAEEAQLSPKGSRSCMGDPAVSAEADATRGL